MVKPMRIGRLFIILLVFFLIASPVLAHVPEYPDDNTTPEQAVEISDPIKSWAFYDSLGEGTVKYYRVTLHTGERLHVGTFTPRTGGFTPSIVVMSPALHATDPVPEGVTVPDGMGAIVVEGNRPNTATYEPFTPSANYHTASFDQQVETERIYVIAVYEPANQAGPVGVTIGYQEEWSPMEYLTIPFDLFRTHLWEGQHPLLVFGPFFLTILVGIGVVRRRWHSEWGGIRLRIALTGAGLLAIGTAVNTAVQMSIALAQTGLTLAALLTTVFVIIPVVGGSWVVGLGLQPDYRLTSRRRVGLAITGTLVLLTWAGFIIGPVILIGLAVAPSRVFTE
ncbi:hypothetical protein [Natronomonas sp.]|uniref:hypothetical protein n=1 Tax=Natronomonas sp. TaxID=2184060 RepID=UPI003974E9A6